ncbi:MAG: hypothetical protein HC836_30410 [Richelia sp. RM2_1_2]|nr:hypothetical protein [Richelia sp. RM2_1_2]
MKIFNTLWKKIVISICAICMLTVIITYALFLIYRTETIYSIIGDWTVYQPINPNTSCVAQTENDASIDFTFAFVPNNISATFVIIITNMPHKISVNELNGGTITFFNKSINLGYIPIIGRIQPKQLVTSVTIPLENMNTFLNTLQQTTALVIQFPELVEFTLQTTNIYDVLTSVVSCENTQISNLAK